MKELTIIIVFAYLSYLCAENFHFSGIITLFCCGFTMAHYAFYNVSEECQTGSVLTMETSSSIAESFLYAYLGLSAISIDVRYVNPMLIACVLITTIVARLLSVFIPLGIMYIFKRGKLSIKLNEAVLIAIGGIIRGAIAFGLSL